MEESKQPEIEFEADAGAESKEQANEMSKEIDLGDSDPANFARRISRDDAQLQKHLGGLDFTDMGALRAKRSTMADLKQAKTFTEGVVVNAAHDKEEQIFAANVDIAQSPNQINIDNSDSKNKTSDSKNLLDAIMDEDDDSDSSSEEKPGATKGPAQIADQEKKETKVFNEDDEISDGERQRILDELALDSDEDDDDDSSSEDEEADDSKR